ncbi:MAG: pilus assembly PilX N-terminal domain-containing protein [Cocleimonas sp.]
MKKSHTVIKKYQSGMTLVIAMILLLVITGVGVSAVKMSKSDTLASGNSVLSMLVFQGAESTLVNVASFQNLYHLNITANASSKTHNVTNLPTEQIMGGGTLSSSASMSYEGLYKCPIISGMANSTDYQCQVFQINAKTESFGAVANHTEGKAIVSP